MTPQVEDRRNNPGNYLSSDPQNKKYSSKYRVKNVGELKMLLTSKGSTQPTT